MPGCELYVKIDEPFQGQVAEEWIRRVVEKTLIQEEINSPVELGLVITDDETIRQLNRSYRGKDETTDVLSFALMENRQGEAETPFVSPPDGTTHLGEVLLSYPRAAIQARERKHSLEQELALLVIHGVLHLLGYRDEDAAAEARMRAAEKRVLGEMIDEPLL